MDPNQEKIISKVVARAWLDRALYQRFLTEPMTVLREAGAVLSGVAVVVVVLGMGEATAATHHPTSDANENPVVCEVVLPPQPANLDEEDLNATASDTLIAFVPKRLCAC